ncbi:MAG TPA: HAMP domain-containing sensor histidine kinase [Candidatus Melainabacteria bacterium]|nr:HAMP domain-containing sensor histidine kinase [Candidatus Melainabacteria bacterium]
MFRGLRIRLTLWFMLLSGVAFFLLAIGNTYLFQKSLTQQLDDELKALTEQVSPLVYIVRNDLQARDLVEQLHRSPFGYKTTVQLFDAHGNLDEEHGEKGNPKLFLNTCEVKSVSGTLRSKSVPLFQDGHLFGYLQIQIPTTQRDLSVDKFILSKILLGPIFLLGLAFAGYLVSGKAVEPVEESYRILKMFVQDASHELKTPVATIQITAENLADDLKEDEDLSERLAIITRNTDRMSNLVSDMLTLAKMEVAQSEPKLVKLNLKDILSRQYDDFTPRFQAGEKELALQLSEAPAIMGDAESLNHLFSNLIENALKYSEKGASVKVNLKSRDGKACVVVEDTGLGIPKDSIPRLFDRFYRVDKKAARAKGGTGLGLSIVKTIADMHHAAIEVASTEGKGTSFTVTFPAA